MAFAHVLRTCKSVNGKFPQLNARPRRKGPLRLLDAENSCLPRVASQRPRDLMSTGPGDALALILPVSVTAAGHARTHTVSGKRTWRLSWEAGHQVSSLNTSVHTASPTHTDANGHYSHLPLLFSPLSGALFPTTSHDPVLCLLLTLPPWEIHTRARTREEASSAWGGWAWEGGPRSSPSFPLSTAFISTPARLSVC